MHLIDEFKLDQKVRNATKLLSFAGVSSFKQKQDDIYHLSSSFPFNGSMTKDIIRL